MSTAACWTATGCRSRAAGSSARTSWVARSGSVAGGARTPRSARRSASGASTRWPPGSHCAPPAGTSSATGPRGWSTCHCPRSGRGRRVRLPRGDRPRHHRRPGGGRRPRAADRPSARQAVQESEYQAQERLRRLAGVALGVRQRRVHRGPGRARRRPGARTFWAPTGPPSPFRTMTACSSRRAAGSADATQVASRPPVAGQPPAGGARLADRGAAGPSRPGAVDSPSRLRWEPGCADTMGTPRSSCHFA